MEEMTREVELDCDPERAWEALTEESELSEWLGGDVEADLKPGGEITVREEDGTERSGFFESVEPGREVSFWWSSDHDDEDSTRVELELLPSFDGEGCVVRVTESRPLIALETELAEITADGPDTGPVMSAAFACV